jgi:hypothetical protein
MHRSITAHVGPKSNEYYVDLDSMCVRPREELNMLNIKNYQFESLVEGVTVMFLGTEVRLQTVYQVFL